MFKVIKKVLCLTLASCMLISTVDTVAFAEENEEFTSECVCEDTCQAYGYESVIDTQEIAALSSSDEEGWTYDENSNTLTLTNYTGTSIDTFWDETASIYSNGDLNICLVGNNVLGMEADYGIYCGGKLKINGEGSLTVSNTVTSIYAASGIEVGGEAILSLSDADKSIYAKKGDIVLNDTQIVAYNDISNEYSGDVIINGGTISCWKITAYNNMIINDGTVKGALSAVGIIINDGTINAYADVNKTTYPYQCAFYGISATTITVNSGNLSAGVNLKYSSGRGINGNLIINGGTVVTTGYQGLEGGLLMTGGSLEASGERFAMDATYNDSINIQGGTVLLIPGEEGGLSTNNAVPINISGGELVIKGNEEENSIGWVTEYGYNLSVSGGSFRISGVEYGMEAIYVTYEKNILITCEGQFECDAKKKAFSSDGEVLWVDKNTVYAGSNKDIAELVTEITDEKYIKAMPKTYSLTLDSNGGNVLNPSVMTYINGTIYGILPEPSRAHYTFHGWYTSKSEGTKVTSATVCTGDTTIYAHWTPIKYTVTYDINGGNKLDETGKTISYGDKYGSLPTPTSANCCFAGWYSSKSGGTKVTSSTVCTGDTTIYAHWMTHNFKTTIAKATTSKNGSIVKKCSVCGNVASNTVIYYPKTITLSKTSFVYNSKAQKPKVTVKGADGKIVSSSNYTVTFSSGCKNVGKYTVKISFKGNYSGSVSKTYIIVPKGTSLKSLTAGSKMFTVKWAKQTTRTTGYQIQYSTNSKLTSAKTVTVSKNTTISKAIKKLTGKKKYYVRIRTYKTIGGTKYYSAWSGVKSVMTKK